MNSWRKSKLIKTLASLKLAVVVILAIAVIAAVGTIIEARYDAEAAAAWVYRSTWMYLVLATLCINLISVMVDRWPWQKRHTGFVCAHIGIITLLLGGVITQKMGVDGSLFLPLHGKSHSVTLNSKDIVIYSSVNGESFLELYRKPVDFLTRSAKDNPIVFTVPDGTIEVIDSVNYVIANEKFVADSSEVNQEQGANEKGVNENSGIALRFQIHNQQASLVDWMFVDSKGLPVHRKLGPLHVYLNETPPTQSTQNALYFQTTDQLDQIKYTLVSKNGDHKTVVGTVKESESFVTPWMGFKVSILRLIPKAKREWDFKPIERPTATATSALKVRFNGKEQWVQSGDIARFNGQNNNHYVVKYGQQQIDIGTEIGLKDFEVGRYQGTRRAMSYRSLVDVPGLGERSISMNEPLKFKGYTFYQSSFEEGDDGTPVASILSVNYDPGRVLKYLGSLIMVFGIAHLFWWKKIQAKKSENK